MVMYVSDPREAGLSWFGDEADSTYSAHVVGCRRGWNGRVLAALAIRFMLRPRLGLARIGAVVSDAADCAM
jgi:hypothetical protein